MTALTAPVQAEAVADNAARAAVFGTLPHPDAPRFAAPERAWQAAVLREVIGDPFRPPTFDPKWRTADVVGLARAVYEDRAFDRLPLLADALLDAGCDDDQVLAHCRSPGSHVRGCWVVDLTLGLE